MVNAHSDESRLQDEWGIPIFLPQCSRKLVVSQTLRELPKLRIAVTAIAVIAIVQFAIAAVSLPRAYSSSNLLIEKYQMHLGQK